MIQFLRRCFLDSRGITAIEYGLIAGVLALGIIAAVGGVAGQLQTAYQNISGMLKTGSTS
jgi:pilus assembly protein Flp/PilA